MKSQKNPKIKPEKERSRKRKDIFEENYIVNGRDAVNRKTRSKEKEKRSKKRK